MEQSLREKLSHETIKPENITQIGETYHFVNHERKLVTYGFETPDQLKNHIFGFSANTIPPMRQRYANIYLEGTPTLTKTLSVSKIDAEIEDINIRIKQYENELLENHLCDETPEINEAIENLKGQRWALKNLDKFEV